MKPYKKTWQAWWMTTDDKPRGKEKRIVEKITRSKLKEETKKEINDWYKED